MRYLAFGITLFAFVACNGASGEEQLSTDPGSSQKAQALPSPNQGRSSRTDARAPKASRSVSQPLPLSSAETYASEHSARPSVSVQKPASPATNSWTGFYLGVGVGGAQQ